MLRPIFPRLSHPRLAQAIPSIACIAQVYLGGTRGFRQDLGGEGDRSTATGASTSLSTFAGPLALLISRFGGNCGG